MKDGCWGRSSASQIASHRVSVCTACVYWPATCDAVFAHCICKGCFVRLDVLRVTYHQCTWCPGENALVHFRRLAVSNVCELQCIQSIISRSIIGRTEYTGIIALITAKLTD